MEFENDFFALSRPALQSGGDDRRAHDLPITKQAAALTISRASVYYLPRPVSAADLALMRWIDELHLESGSRLMRHLLRGERDRPSACHDSAALYGHPRTTKPESGHKVYPYLLRCAAITRPNQV